MTTLTLEKKIYDDFKANKMYYGVYEDYNGRIVVEVNWGDWKHDHAYIKWYLEENFDLVCVFTEITEEDGSDCYSAIHYFEKASKLEEAEPEVINLTLING